MQVVHTSSVFVLADVHAVWKVWMTPIHFSLTWQRCPGILTDHASAKILSREAIMELLNAVGCRLGIIKDACIYI